MTFANKFKDNKKFYTFVIILILFFNVNISSKLNASSFTISEIEVSEEFNLDFTKKKVFDKAFKKAFVQLISTVITLKDKKKLKTTSLATIKSLIDSFNISDEKFIEDKYFAKINVNFNKKNAYDFFESKNIFPSIPNRLEVLIIPILVNNSKEEVIFFSENPVYKNWNRHNEKYYLLNYVLPTEDIEDRELLKNNIELIEEYKFDEIISKYDLKDHIILIINQNNNNINILSKLYLKGVYKILNVNYKYTNIYEEEGFVKLIYSLKSLYEDEWKKINLINTSIKLPLTISLPSKNFDKIKLFEKALINLDLVSNFSVLSFNNHDIYYKIIYNGSPDKFVNEVEGFGLSFEKNDQFWKVK